MSADESPPARSVPAGGARFQLVVRTPAPGPIGASSAAFWFVLEKLGFADFEIVDLETYVRSRPRLGAHLGVLTAPVTAGLGQADLQELLRSEHPLFLEGPWPPELDGEIGASLERGADSVTTGCFWPAAWLEERLCEFLDGMGCPSTARAYAAREPILISPRTSREQRQSDFVSRYAGINEEAGEPSWSIITGEAGSFEILLGDAREDGTLRPPRFILARKGALVVSSCQLLSYVAQDYTAPYEHHRYSFSRDRYPLEFLLVSVLTELLRDAYSRTGIEASIAAALASLRISPWPRGAQWALTVRHDVDRVPSRSAVEKLLLAESRAGAGVSCYFLETTAEEKTIRAFADAGAEIGYHSMHLEPSAQKEIASIERHLRQRIAGSTVHGTTGFFGWRGAANWEIARELGFIYTEHLNCSRYFPSRVFKLEAGYVKPYELVALPHHVSIDRDRKHAYVEENRSALEVMARNQMHVILMNHPDMNVDAVATLLEGAPAGAIGLTAVEVARWWRATHFRDALSFRIEKSSNDAVTIALLAADPVEGLTFDLPGAVTVERAALDGQPLAPRRLRRYERSTLSAGGTRLWFDVPQGEHRLEIAWGAQPRGPVRGDVMSALEESILRWFARDHGKPTVSAERTASFNSVDVHRRVAPLIAPVAKQIADPHPQVVLDVGCGFGGLALYLASQHRHLHVDAIDVSSRFFCVAEETAAELGMTNVSFRTCNLLGLSERERYDLVLLSNMLCFLTSREDLRQACTNAWNATRPGGTIAIYTPHAGSWKEPFTGIPALHKLPMPAREWIAVKTRRRSTMRDVRLPALRELRRMFRALGATSIRWKKQRRGPALRSTHVYMWVTR